MLSGMARSKTGQSCLRIILPRIIYSFLFYLLTPAVLLRLLWRSIREPSYRETLLQRFGYPGFIPQGTGPLIWVHAVSAGETIAAVPLIRKLIARDFRILVTTMTPTGRERVQTLLADTVLHCYAPYDLPGSVARFLRKTNPKCLVIIDTELWPNIIHQCSINQVKTILVNGRLSARSAAGYQKVAWLTKRMFEELDFVAVQTSAHGKRFVDLGLSAEKLLVAGSIKFDHRLPGDYVERVARLKEKVGNRLVVIGASTHPGEEEMILRVCSALRAEHPELLLVLAPRHQHRSDEVAALVKKNGDLLVLHSHQQPCDGSTTVLMLDTMGELTYFYGVSDIAIVGGSLVPVGGHNLMEAVVAGVPVVMGRYLDNIDDIASMFEGAGGLRIARDEQQLLQELGSLLASVELRQKLASNASEVLNQNRGALGKVEQLIAEAVS